MSTIEEMGCGNPDLNEIIFPHLGIDVTIDPTAFTLFGINIQWYGLLITFGMLLALIYGFRNMVRVGIDPDRAIDAVIGGIIGGLVGARAYYVIFNWEEFADNIPSIFNTRGGGLAIYGGVIGALLVGGIVAKIRKARLLPLLDVVGVGFLLGQGIGRWGNFTNQEAFGSNTDSLFCMTGGRIQRWIEYHYTAAGDPSLNPNYAVHPCFLYESAWCLLGFVLLAIVSRKWRKFDGQIFLMYIGWYGLGRFLIEGLRTDSLMIGTLRVSQVLAALCVVFAVVMLIVCGSKVKRMGRDYVLYCNSKESRELLEQAAARAEEAYLKYMEKKAAQLEKKEAKLEKRLERKILPDEDIITTDKQEDENNGKTD
ncbi:MAG: prolipoprotein diacylglyceryl transferase [Oscillospiraceae bacterium]|nr:prolipoprotein diacylglyceryl transferase [Oscillospiraceae bacterium]